MKCYVGLGSNLGHRLENLERAVCELNQVHRVLRVSPVYQNPAMVPVGAPPEWNLAFLNAVVEVESNANPLELLRDLKRIEEKLGRVKSARWAPRLIDLDLILWGSETFRSEELEVPHPGLWDRPFVLDPLKDLAPSLKPPGKANTVLKRARELTGHSPLWMGILNLTPDSFSDGGKFNETDRFLQKAREMTAAGVQILDIGAESTRPGALPVSEDEEWARLKEPLELLIQETKGKFFRPLISIDTRRASVAEKALALGADWINDVSGLHDESMIRLIAKTNAPCVFMHSLSVPADKTVTLPRELDPVNFLKGWAFEKIESLDAKGVSADRLIFDPGIGFGKTEIQSLDILKRIGEFQALPVPILVGHSRKSFMRLWTGEKPINRDGDSIGVSLRLIESGVDLLRVHEPALHLGAFLAWSHL